MTQNGTWAEGVVRTIAAEVRRYRKRAGMSAQQLADECEKRGLPIRRSVLANLESGRRAVLGVPELLVLADVLGVPAIFLLFPVGYAERVEMLPGHHERPEDAIAWFTGTGQWGGARGPNADNAAGLFRDHAYAVSAWQRATQEYDALWAARGIGDASKDYENSRLLDVAARNLEAAASLGRAVRHRMREVGMTVLPPLPEGLKEPRRSQVDELPKEDK